MNHISKLKGTRAQSVLVELIVIIIIIIIILCNDKNNTILARGTSFNWNDDRSCWKELRSDIPPRQAWSTETLPKRTLILFEDFEKLKMIRQKFEFEKVTTSKRKK